MTRREYSASAVKMSLWFDEFRKAVAFLNDGKSLQDIKDLSDSENIFAASTPARAKQISSSVCARIESLDGSVLGLFAESDLSTQKLIALVAAMAYDSLFFDFVYEVVREKMLIGTNELTDMDTEEYFRDKRLQSEKVARWTDATFVRLGGAYKTMLYEAGILENTKGTRRIRKAILMPEFEDWLSEHGMESYAHALAGER